MNLRIALTGLAIMLFAGTVFAEGVPINPGQWEMTATIEMSLLPKPQVRTSMECLTESELNPKDFNMDNDDPCDITDVVIDGNSARWSILCPVEDGVQMEGQWEFTSSGDSIKGTGSMSSDANGMQIEFKMDWEGKRVGDCS